MITIDQFRAVELRVGTVRTAEPHPNAPKNSGASANCGASSSGTGGRAAW